MTMPPPWIHTSTGRRPASALVCTSRWRQSSPSTIVWGTSPVGSTGCGAVGPGRVQSRTSVQVAGGSGGRNRRAPVGGAANGMPRNVWTPPPCSPRTSPDAVVAVLAGLVLADVGVSAAVITAS